MAEPNPRHEPDGESVLRRERGSRRVSTTTRWTVAAAAAGTAALGLTYTHLLPGAPGATSAGSSAQSGQPGCTPTSPATAPVPAPAPAPAQVSHGERDDEGGSAGDAEGRTADAVQPAAAVCPGGAANGLTPPGQPPAAAQQAPQTRTGAS